MRAAIIAPILQQLLAASNTLTVLQPEPRFASVTNRNFRNSTIRTIKIQVINNIRISKTALSILAQSSISRAHSALLSSSVSQALLYLSSNSNTNSIIGIKVLNTLDTPIRFELFRLQTVLSSMLHTTSHFILFLGNESSSTGLTNILVNVSGTVLGNSCLAHTSEVDIPNFTLKTDIFIIIIFTSRHLSEDRNTYLIF